MPDKHLVDVHVLVIRDHELLLTRRRDSDPAFDGMWHLPSGKLDAGESVLDAAVREVHEEIGIRIEPADLHHVHTNHVTGSGLEPRLGLYFVTQRWTGEPTNCEPDKCSELRWFGLDDLPDDVIAYPAAGIHGYITGTTFSTYGWE